MVTLGIYEKALPKNISWRKRLALAKQLGFDFVELSIDETDERLARLDWTDEQRKEVWLAIQESGVKILSMCLSGHRRFPFGSHDSQKREQALNMMTKAIELSSDLGIRIIQLAGYDVYYEPKSVNTRANFIKNLKKAVALAAAKEVVLAIEIMDDPFISSVSNFLKIKQQIHSPYLQVYPDLGNLSAWPDNDVGAELERGLEYTVAIHLKDTLAVTDQFPGKFKDVPFGSGCVDFLGCLNTLKSLDYNGPFVIEMWNETKANPVTEIERAFAFLHPYLKEAGYVYE